jgi:hypothetical protein
MLVEDQSKFEAIEEVLKIHGSNQGWWPVIIIKDGKYAALPEAAFIESDDKIIFELQQYKGDHTLESIANSF